MAIAAVWRPAEIVTDRGTFLFQTEQKENEALCGFSYWKSRFPPFVLLSGDIMVHRCRMSSKCSASANLLCSFASAAVFH